MKNSDEKNFRFQNSNLESTKTNLSDLEGTVSGIGTQVTTNKKQRHRNRIFAFLFFRLFSMRRRKLVAVSVIKEICHTAEAYPQSRHIVKKCRKRRLDNTRNAEHNQSGIEPDNKSVISFNAQHKHLRQPAHRRKS